MALYTGGSSSFVASTTAPIATGWSEPVPGWEFHPLLTSAFHGALPILANGRTAGTRRVKDFPRSACTLALIGNIQSSPLRS